MKQPNYTVHTHTHTLKHIFVYSLFQRIDWYEMDWNAKIASQPRDLQNIFSLQTRVLTKLCM